MTVLEIIDTTVKVGLGAIIGGMFTYLIAKLNHENEMEKERLRRRREILEEIASKCDNFSKQCRDYWALLADWVEAENPDANLPEHRVKIKESEKQFYNAFHDLSSAEGRLLLLGENEARAKLREYALFAQNFYSNVYIGCAGMEKEKIQKYKENLLLQYENVLAALSTVYKRNT